MEVLQCVFQLDFKSAASSLTKILESVIDLVGISSFLAS